MIANSEYFNFFNQRSSHFLQFLIDKIEHFSTYTRKEKAYNVIHYTPSKLNLYKFKLKIIF
jgi:hypothetical protein